MANAPAALSSAPAKLNRPILKMTGISKRFPGVLALEDVHLEVGQAEIHALLGENGAGKSTLLKILSGAHSANSGKIELFGELVAFASPHDAQRAGIVTIYQEFTLAPDMTIAENVFIGREPGSRLFMSWRRLAEDTSAITDKIGLKRDPMTPCAISRSPSSSWSRSPARFRCGRSSSSWTSRPRRSAKPKSPISPAS